ncbi:hypothetical protein O0L34_g7472 [Tuta absoluta]|nr:hypothetical protein O0L34_g7472 [Tuta absoluta]
MYLSSISSRLLLFDTNSWDLKKSYGCYNGILRDISWSDDSKYLLQVNAKGLVEILSATENDIRSLQHIPLKDTWSASFHRDGHRNVAIGTKNGNVLIWDTKNKTITKTFPTPPHQSSVNYISFNAKNTSLAATMYNGDTIIYGLVSNIPVLTVKLASSRSISAMKFHHESRSLLGIATEEGHMVLRDITTNKDKAFFENVHASPVSDFAYSLVNKDVMLSSGYDKLMHVYDVRLQNVVSTTRTTYTLTSLAINIENQVALGSKNGSVLIYDLRDLSTPLQDLNGHNDEVRRVAFQPMRKKLNLTEISIQEENDAMTTPIATKSPSRSTRNSDMFYVNDSPTKNNNNDTSPGGNKEDSFLVLMGLDKSNNLLLEQDGNTSSLKGQSNSHFEMIAERDVSKASTPLNVNSNKVEQFNNFVSPVDSNTIEELKDFIKLNIADVADDNRSYFLHIMMGLTKQKLYLEKQLSSLSEQMRTMLENQNAIINMNRKLAFENQMLKSQKNIK